MLRPLILISLFLAFALGQASCGGTEVPEIDANYELQERARIDAAIADLDVLRADPEQGQIAAAAIGRYLRARDEARRFNESLGEELGIEEGDELPPGVAPVIADDELLNPAREAVPSLFGPTGEAVVPEDLRQFRAAAASDLVAAMRPAVADPAELLLARATRESLDAIYPDRDGLTRHELVADAAAALEPYWPDLASELESAIGRSG